jgi:RNA polymerase sigma-70 factor (ECF subfamily)
MWPEADKTQELMTAARGGDADAAGRLLERHRESLRRMIDLRLDRRIRQRVDASDIVQDAMVEANRRLQAYLADPVIPFHLWIRQIAKDRVIDAHRRHRASGKRSVDRERQPIIAANLDHSTMEFVQQLCDPELTPAAAATMQELQRRFDAALEVMDEQDREVVIMRHFENLSNQDVARTLGLSEPAASMRHLRAIRKLRQMLADPFESHEA